MTDTNYLKYPLYGLYYIDSINDYHGLDTEELEMFKNEFEEPILEGILKAIKWATKNPDYDFLSLNKDLKFSNSEIYQYLCKLNESLKQL